MADQPGSLWAGFPFGRECDPLGRLPYCGDVAMMFLTGGGMRGGDLHHLLGGAPLVAETRTAPRYRFYAVDGRFPGLYPVSDGGDSVEGELYDVPLDVLRDCLLPAEPPELELGIIALADGGASLAMVLRAAVHDEPGERLVDITSYGTWRAYLLAVG
jgi:Gamma-glutamyl cyclotransferase, AIG2-like